MARRAIHASPSHRAERVGEAVRHALADVLTRGEVADPELARRPATVTEVKMTPDLKIARVLIVPLGGKHGKETVAALAGATQGDPGRWCRSASTSNSRRT